MQPQTLFGSSTATEQPAVIAICSLLLAGALAGLHQLHRWAYRCDTGATQEWQSSCPPCRGEWSAQGGTAGVL